MVRVGQPAVTEHFLKLKTDIKPLSNQIEFPHKKSSRIGIGLKRYLVLIAVMLINLVLVSQVFAVNAGKTPEAYSFNAPQGPQVNLATGDMTLGVPIMTVPGKGISYPVTFSYQAGIKVEQEASWVGLGWNFVPGAVTRESIGIPDDYTRGRDNRIVESGVEYCNLAGFSRYNTPIPDITTAAKNLAQDAARELQRREMSSAYGAWAEANDPMAPSAETPETALAGMDRSMSKGDLGSCKPGRVSQQEPGFLYTSGCPSGSTFDWTGNYDCMSPDSWTVSGIGVSGRLAIEFQQTNNNLNEGQKRFHFYDISSSLLSPDVTRVLGGSSGGVAGLNARFTNPNINQDPVKIEYTLNGPNKAIDSFTITNIDGTKYFYKQPLYYTNPSGNDATDERDAVKKSFDKMSGFESSSQTISLLKRYAYTWLLTMVEDTNGNWIKFNYAVQQKPFHFRAPFGSAQTGLEAYHRSGPDRFDYINQFWPNRDRMWGASASQGWMQVANLASIETDTYIAYFDVSDRADGVEWEPPAVYTLDNTKPSDHIGDGRLKKLDQIKLMKKTTSGEKQVSGVRLKYDYSLQNGIPNFDPATKKGEQGTGKLTLKEISFSGQPTVNYPDGIYKDGRDPQPYRFEYAYGNIPGDYDGTSNKGHNPNWIGDPLDAVDYRYDNFGYFYIDGSKMNHMILDRLWHEDWRWIDESDKPLKYDPKKKYSDVRFADAWSLTKINWPTGGTTRMDYEIDRYSFVGKEPTKLTTRTGFKTHQGIYDTRIGMLYTGAGRADAVSASDASLINGLERLEIVKDTGKTYDQVPDINIRTNGDLLNLFISLGLSHIPYINRMMHYGGGIRVKTIENNPAPGSDNKNVVNYHYTITRPDLDESASNSEIAEREGIHTTYASNFLSFVGSEELGHNYNDYEEAAQYDIDNLFAMELGHGLYSSGVLSKPTYPHEMNVPMQVYYGRVIEEVNNGYDGIVVHDFSTPYTNPAAVDMSSVRSEQPKIPGGHGYPNGLHPFAQYKDTSMNWGIEFMQKSYQDRSTIPISTVRNEFELVEQPQAGWSDTLLSKARLPEQGYTGDYLLEYSKKMSIIPTWTRLKSTESTVDGVKTITDYKYNNVNGMQSEIVVYGEGVSKRVSATRFTFDVRDDFPSLTQLNILNKPYVAVAGGEEAMTYLDPSKNSFSGKAVTKTVYDYYTSPSCISQREGTGFRCSVGLLKSSKIINAEDLAASPVMTTERYTDFGAPERTIDPKGNFIEVRYDPDGNPTIGWDSLVWSSQSNPSWRNTYDELGRIIKMCDANNICTEFQYDLYSRMIKSIKPGDDWAMPSVEYDYMFTPPGRITTRTKINSQQKAESAHVFDGMARAIQSIINLRDQKISSEITYTRNGKVYQTTKLHYTTVQNPLKVTNEYYPDPLNRIKSVTSLAGTKVQSEYGNAGNFVTVRVIDELGNAVVTKKDCLGDTVELMTPDRSVTALKYDVLGRVTEQTDALGHVSKNVYNTLNRLVRTEHPDLGWSQMEYDKNGNIKKKVTPKGEIIYDYDSIDRITKASYSDRSSFSYYYDIAPEGSLTSCANGKERLCMVKGDYGTTAYDYDERGRIKRLVHAIGGKQYAISYDEYDSADNVVSFTNPKGVKTTYTYDDANRVSTVKAVTRDGRTVDIATYTYNPSNTIDTILFGNQAATKYGYTARDWLESIDTKKGSAALFMRSYDFDAVGNIKSMYNSASKAGKLADFGYDALYRLKSVTDNNYYGTNIAFTYDVVGNRLAETTNKGSSSYMYDYMKNPGSQSIKLLSVSGPSEISFGYDAAGNTIKKNNMAFKYDIENRLVCAGDDYAYVYDPSGKRVKKIQLLDQGNTKTTVYVYDAAGNIVYEESVDNLGDDGWLFADKCIGVGA